MGGSGSGPTWASRYTLVERSTVLDVHALVREHRRRPEVSAWLAKPEEYAAELRWGFDGSQTLRFICTPGTYGGSVLWLRCPCGRRCRKLYLPPGRTRYACRVCHQLRYRSQRLSIADRWQHRAAKLYDRIGGRARGLIKRPRGMHRVRFNRLREEASGYEAASFGWRFQGIFGRLS